MQAFTTALFQDFTPAAIIFDCDGTLLDTQSVWTKVINELLAEHLIVLDEETANAFVGNTVEAVVGAVAELIQQEPQEVGEELGRRYFADLKELRSKGEFPLMPGAEEILQIVSQKLPVAVASNSLQPKLSQNLEDAGLIGYLDFIIGANQVNAGKPQPDIYLRAAELLGKEPGECLVFEDSNNGAQAAIAAGMKVIFIEQIPGQVSVGDHKIKSLADPELISWLNGLKADRSQLPSEHPLGILRHYIPQGIVFDCDGLLLDTESVWDETQKYVLAQLGVELSDEQSQSLMGTTLEQTAEIISSNTEIDFEYIAREIKTEFRRRLAKEIQLMEGALEFVKLAATKVPLAVASNSWHEALEDKLSRTSILGYLENVQSSNTVENVKPAGDMFVKAAVEMGVEPSNCLAFEDSPLGAKAAKAAGLRLIAIPSRHSSIEIADLNLDSLANPDLIEWVKTWPARKK